MNLRRFLPAIVSAVFGALTLASCGEAKLGIDDQNKIIDIGNSAEPLTLDPGKASGVQESNIIGNMFIGLFTEDVDANAVPGMAERWEVSPDGLTWTFFLRRANWSDGVPVTAYDFEYAYRRVLNPETIAEYAAILYPFKNAQAVKEGKMPLSALGVHAIDERTLEINLEGPAPFLPGLLKHQTAYPIPKHVVEKFGDDWIKPQHVVVNGPYTLVKWWSNYVVHLRKNPLFYDAASVCLRELFFYPTNDSDAAMRRVQSGELAWNTAFPGQKFELLKKELPGYVHASPYMLTVFLSFNLKLQKFQDDRVRKALSMAVDRDFITKEIYRKGYIPAYALVPPRMPNYAGGARVQWADEPVEKRRDEARRLLAAAGYGPNKPLKFVYSFRNSSDNPRVAVVLQDDWRKIAPWVQVELRPTEVQIHYANLRGKDFELGDGGWVGDFPDATTYLFLMETRTGQQNYPGYSNPVYDDLMMQASRELDATKRSAIMLQAEQIMLNDDPIVPIAIGASQNVINPRITGFKDNIEDWHRARYMCIADKK